MEKVDIYEPYVHFRCQKLHESMRKIAQSDWSRVGRLYIGRRNASDFADRRVMRGLVSNFRHYTVSGSQS